MTSFVYKEAVLEASSFRNPFDVWSDFMEENSKLPRVIKLANPLKDSTEATFFIVVNPGLEEQARREAEKHLSAGRIETVNGGIQFDSTWGAVRRGQPQLKIASRVLVRVDQFGARDFQKLFRKVSNLPWEDWLKPKVGLQVRAASHGSRLRIKAGIEESVVDAFKKSFRAPPPRPTQELLCLVRVEDDICTISLDISGDLLHKRGSHTDVGVAPLRETWAASIVDRAFEIAGADDELQADFSRGWQWVEPMAGTAVFLREALSARTDENESHGAGENGQEAAREFAVDTCFKFVAEEEAKDQPKTTAEPISVFDPRGTLKSAVIIDRDEAQLERAKQALKDIASSLKTKIDIHYSSSPDSIEKTALAKLVVVNPPWGRRLKGPDATDSAVGQAKLMAQIEKDWEPRLVAVVFPRIAGPAAKMPKGWTEHRGLDFRAGGIPVTARFFTVARRGR